MLVHRRVTPSSKFASTHLYSWVERGTVRVKCLAQEHNAMTRPGLEPGPSDPESNALTIRPPRHPLTLQHIYRIFGELNRYNFNRLPKSFTVVYSAHFEFLYFSPCFIPQSVVRTPQSMFYCETTIVAHIGALKFVLVSFGNRWK